MLLYLSTVVLSQQDIRTYMIVSRLQNKHDCDIREDFGKDVWMTSLSTGEHEPCIEGERGAGPSSWAEK